MAIPRPEYDDLEDELACSQKLSFSTQKDAEASATVAEFRYGSALKSYRCSYCGLWHLASHYE